MSLLYEKAGRVGFPMVIEDGVTIAGATAWKAAARLSSPRVQARLAEKLEKLGARERQGQRPAWQPLTNPCTLVRRAADSTPVDRPEWEPSVDAKRLLTGLRAYPAVAASFEQMRVVTALMRHLADHPLPAYQLSFHAAPADTVARGTAVYVNDHERVRYSIYIRADLIGRELAHVFLHECQHLIDMRSGLFPSLTVGEGDRRADAFARRELTVFEEVFLW